MKYAICSTCYENSLRMVSEMNLTRAILFDRQIKGFIHHKNPIKYKCNFCNNNYTNEYIHYDGELSIEGVVNYFLNIDLQDHLY